MKYRTGFVTNSSSTSFGVAFLQILAGAAGAFLLGTASGSAVPLETEPLLETKEDGHAGSTGKQEPAPYYLETAVTSDNLLANGRYYIWLYARVCSRSGQEDTARLTEDINFSKSGIGGDLLRFIDFGMAGGFKCACAVATRPSGASSGKDPGTAEIVASAHTPAGMIQGSELIHLQIPGTR
jgi:hypothetical protein